MKTPELSGKILVTGGAGFIGSHLVDALASMSDTEIVVLDNLTHGSVENVKQHLDAAGFELVRGDVRDRDLVRRLIADVDYVFHLAALIEVQTSLKEPQLTDEINVQGTLNILEAARDADVKRIVYASSCAVYGEPKFLPVSEEHPTAPLSPYGASKLAAEAYCIAYHHTYGLKTVALRYFNVYGPRQFRGPYSGVITIFLERALQGKPLIIYGDGKQTRDFVYVKDVVDACILAASKQTAIGHAINVGTGKETSIIELADIIKRLTGASVPIKHDPPLKGDIRKSVSDTRKAERLLGYKPEFTLAKGLKETYAWFKKQLKTE